MGHSGLDITLDSYFHFADFILGRLSLRLVSYVSNEVLAKLSGFSPAYIGEIVGNEVRDHDDLDRRGRKIERLADKQIKGRQRGVEAELLPDVGTADNLVYVPPDSPFQRLLYIARVISQVEAGENDLTRMARRFGLDLLNLTAWHSRVEGMRAGLFQVDGGRDDDAGSETRQSPGCLIDLPEGPAQQSMAERTLKVLMTLWDSGDLPKEKKLATQNRIEALLQTFPLVWVRGTYLTVETGSVPDAKRWMWFLEKLDLVEAVGISHVCSTGKDVPSAERQRAHWEAALGRSVLDAKSQKVEEGTRGRVMVDVDLRKLNKDWLLYEKKTILYGVRFMLGILAVCGARSAAWR